MKTTSITNVGRCFRSLSTAHIQPVIYKRLARRLIELKPMKKKKIRCKWEKNENASCPIQCVTRVDIRIPFVGGACSICPEFHPYNVCDTLLLMFEWNANSVHLIEFLSQLPSPSTHHLHRHGQMPRPEMLEKQNAGEKILYFRRENSQQI